MSVKVQQPASAPQSKPQQSDDTTQVKKGESLQDVARRTGTDEQELQRLNPDLPATGQLPAGREIRTREAEEQRRIDETSRTNAADVSAYERAEDAAAPQTARPAEHDAPLPAADENAAALADSTRMQQHALGTTSKQARAEMRNAPHELGPVDEQLSNVRESIGDLSGALARVSDAVGEASSSRQPAWAQKVDALSNDVQHLAQQVDGDKAHAQGIYDEGRRIKMELGKIATGARVDGEADVAQSAEEAAQAAGALQDEARRLKTDLIASHSDMPVTSTEDAAPAEDAGETTGIPALTADDVDKLGAAYADGKTKPTQMLWGEQAVNTVLQRGSEQGLISDEKKAAHGALAESVLPGTGAKQGEVDPASLSAIAREAGIPLEKQDPNQLVAASRYINAAPTLDEQRNRLNNTLNTMSMVDEHGKLPKLSREEQNNLMWGAAKIPGHATAKLNDAKLADTFQDVARATNTPGKSEFKVGSHKAKIAVNDDGKVTSSSVKKPSVLSKVGNALKKAAPIALTVASFIPVTAPFAKAAQLAISAVKAVKSKNILGVVSSAAGALSSAAGAFKGAAASALVRAGDTIKNTAGAVNAGINAIKAKSAGGILGALSSGATAIAGFSKDATKGVAASLTRFGDKVAKYSHAANAADAIVRKDFATAVSSGLAVGAQVAMKNKNEKLAGQLFRRAQDVATADFVQQSVRKGDFTSAANAVTTLASKRTNDPKTRERLQRTSRVIQNAGVLEQAVKTKNWSTTAAAASTIASEFTKNGLVTDARRISTAADELDRALRTGEGDKIREAGRKLLDETKRAIHPPLESRPIAGIAEAPVVPTRRS